MRKAYYELDKNHDGHVSVEEILAAMKAEGLSERCLQTPCWRACLLSLPCLVVPYVGNITLCNECESRQGVSKPASRVHSDATGRRC